jgi:hypothetical protein
VLAYGEYTLSLFTSRFYTEKFTLPIRPGDCILRRDRINLNESTLHRRPI